MGAVFKFFEAQLKDRNKLKPFQIIRGKYNVNGRTDKEDLTSTFFRLDRFWSNDSILYTATVTDGSDHRSDGHPLDQ
jgi:hypothetical protein